MGEGIILRILGDYGPFSRIGKSIGYQVTAGGSDFLVDCGSPLFQQIGGHGLKEISNLIITHCHDDHKRWFSDLALFNRYAPDVSHKVTLFASESVMREITRASGPALDTSLSPDSKQVIDIPFSDYVHPRIIGPLAKYIIHMASEGPGSFRYTVVDRKGNPLGPDRAKVVISPATERPRLLFRDPDYGEWVEPESFYSFSSRIFYEEEQNPYIDRSGLIIEAVKAPVWHGLPATGIRFRSPAGSLFFSSDTLHDVNIWKQLCTEKRKQKLATSVSEFASCPVLRGDINDFIERAWSEERYNDAVTAFDNAVVLHDISTRNSPVHTDYRSLVHTVLRKDRTILTHSPDRMTSRWPLSDSGKAFSITGSDYHEMVDGSLFPLDADIYHKEDGKYFVGYRNENGRHTVFERDGILYLAPGEPPENVTVVFKVELFQDVSGKYFPKLEDDNSGYHLRPDGKVELVVFGDEGSSGTVVEHVRGKIGAKKR